MSMWKNRTVWLFALALVGAGGDGGGGGGDTAFTVSWNLFYVGADSGPSCAQAGTPQVVLGLVRVQDNAKFSKTFSCDAGGGQTPNLPPGTYETRISLLRADGQEVSFKTGQFDLAGGQVEDLGTIGFQVQSFHLAWSLAQGAHGVACGDVGAQTVDLVTRLNSEPEVTYSFPCGSGSGSTSAVLLGTYSVGIRLVGAGNNVLWETNPPMTIQVDDKSPADLGTVTFNL